ncbi:hypothetical protein MKX03_033332, partial [Papaver bracteatum]
MERFQWLKIVVLLWLFTITGARELQVKHMELQIKQSDHGPVYNHTLAKILVEYASAVYMSDLTELFTWTCSRCDDMIREFEVLELIVDVQHCLQ